MFCHQCEQTYSGTGCTNVGACGKQPDIQSLQEILLYGVKGMAAYAHHARRLGQTDEEVNAFVERALISTMTNVNFDFDALLEMVLECGEKNLRVMAMLDAGHTQRFGYPSPCAVYEGTKAGPGILVTGHDLVDLAELLEQTADSGVSVYTHGEMLPAHSYPKLRSYPHLAGHFGTAWHYQNLHFSEFTGPVVATTNCLLIPWDSYKDRVFTTGLTAVPGGTRLNPGDFQPVIQCARACPPLPERGKLGRSMIGYHHTVVLGLADRVVEAVRSGRLKHVYLIGGCDGMEASRDYFTKVARAVPEDCIILTLGCGKYRIRGRDYGTVAGLPRLLDMGQCNDAFGAIQVARGLAQALDCDVHQLPLTLVVSWLEQKAIAILLSLLHLGIKGIRIGPVPPAFITSRVFQVLQEQFDLRLIERDPQDLFRCASA